MDSIQEVCLNCCWTVKPVGNGIGCMHKNVFYLHLILYFWVFALSVGVFNGFVYVLNACYKFWANWPTKKGFYIYFKYFENKYYFKLHKITHFIKWRFYHYPGVRGMTEKGYHSRIYKPQIWHPLKLECELNHASRFPTLGVTKFNAKKTFWRRNSQEKWL